MNYKAYIARKILEASMYLIPPPQLRPSEYAEQNIRIPEGNALPGLVRFDNVPYQVDPLDMIKNPNCRKITLMWASQTGKTQVVSMMIAYHIGHEPFSQMLMQPTESDYKTWVNTKFNPFVSANTALRRLIAKPRGRDGVNNHNMKQYPGGFFMGAWAGSPNTQRQRSAPKGYADEVDGYHDTEEGNPIELLSQRAATFGDDAMLVVTSTPTIKGESKVEESYLEGDQRKFYIPCPHCQKEINLIWVQVIWDKDKDENGKTKQHYPETARYICQECRGVIDDNAKRIALRSGRWIAAKPFRGHASYHLNELYSPFVSFARIAQSFLDKLASNSLQTFYNVSLAETWEEDGEKVDSTFLYQRREPYTCVPYDATLLTASVDVQGDRLEIGVEAWGENEENWKIDYIVLPGDPSRPAIWNKLTEVLGRKYTHESGLELPITATGIDSSYLTSQVLKYCKGKRRIYALKGKSGEGMPITNKGTANNKQKVKTYTIGVDTAKDTIFQRLVVTTIGAGYIHFPATGLFDEEYFEQLTAEKKMTRYLKKRPVREWVKTRARNEALDLAVYNMAALHILNPKMASLRRNIGFPEKPEATPLAQVVEQIIEAAVSRAKTKVPEPPAPTADDTIAYVDPEFGPIKKRTRRVKSQPTSTKATPKQTVRRRQRNKSWMNG